MGFNLFRSDSSVLGNAWLGKKAIDPDRIHPVLFMFLDRREEPVLFFSFFSFCRKPYCIQMAAFPSGISNN